VPNYPSFDPPAATTEAASTTIASPSTNDQSASGSSCQDKDFQSFDSSSWDSDSDSEPKTKYPTSVRFKPETKAKRSPSPQGKQTPQKRQGTKNPPSPQGKQTPQRRQGTKNPSSPQGKQTPQKRKAAEPAHMEPPFQKPKEATEVPYVRVFVDGNFQHTTVTYGCKDMITDHAICKKCVVIVNLPCLSGLKEMERAVSDHKVVFKFLAADFISNPMILSNLELHGRPVYRGEQDPMLVDMATRALDMEDNGEIVTTVEIEFAERQNFHAAKSSLQGNSLVFESDSVGQPRANRISQHTTFSASVASANSHPYPAEFGHGAAEFGHGR